MFLKNNNLTSIALFAICFVSVTTETETSEGSENNGNKLKLSKRETSEGFLEPINLQTDNSLTPFTENDIKLNLMSENVGNKDGFGESEESDLLDDLAYEQEDKRTNLDRYSFVGALGRRAMPYGFGGQLGKRAPMAFVGQLGKRAPMGFTSQLGKRAPMGFTSQLGKRAPYGFVSQLGKRAPMGFTGQLGKRAPYGFVSQLGKRAPWGFTGQLGKRLPMSFTGQLGKRAPMGFTGQLGKRAPMGFYSQLGKRAPMGFTSQLGKRFMPDEDMSSETEDSAMERQRRSFALPWYLSQHETPIPARFIRGGIDRYSFFSRLGKRSQIPAAFFTECK